jgi:hypothetical protein
VLGAPRRARPGRGTARHGSADRARAGGGDVELIGQACRARRGFLLWCRNQENVDSARRLRFSGRKLRAGG